jgi:hypothetical protein
MSFKKVVLSTVAAATLATSVMATVTVEADSRGNNLKFPVYFALEGQNWKTNFRVINTNTNRSVVAKVVLREGKQSAEKLDFLIYLSPTDVFDATISQENGKVVLTTTDDSLDLTLASEIENNSRVTATEDGKGVKVDLIQEYTAPESIGQNNTYGYIEVYGLIESGKTDVVYSSNATDGNKTVDLSAVGVDHSKFMAAAVGLGSAVLAGDTLDREDAASMTTYGWNEATGGLVGKAAIIGNNANGQLSMAYTAVALENNESSAAAVTDAAWLPAVQRGQDTNFLNFPAGLQMIEDIEEELAKQATYVAHYAKDGRMPASDNSVGTMAETALIANFATKKYSAEMFNNYYQTSTTATAATTHAINSAGGNLFYVKSRVAVNSSVATDKDEVVQRYATVSAAPHNHFEYVGATPVDSGTSGTVPGEKPKAIAPCMNEVCMINVDSSKVDGVDSDQAITTFADGYVTFQFRGIMDRNTSDEVTHMPYIPMVMTGITIEGTNITNISYPSYISGKSVSGTEFGVTGLDRNVTRYNEEYDLVTEIGPKL